jgi:hypothetical protein
VEKAKAEALRQIEDLNGKLEEANGATAAGHEQAKRREAEFAAALASAQAGHGQLEGSIALLKKKSGEAVEELSGQVDKWQKAAAKLEKEKKQ